MNRLKDPAKHENVLLEFAPILKIDKIFSLDFEVSGYGEGNSTIDWLISGAEGAKILLEVKNRILPLVNYLNQILESGINYQNNILKPIYDHSILFKDLEKKFKNQDSNVIIQVIWMKSEIKPNKLEFIDAFSQLDHSKIHAAIVSDWSEDAYIVSKSQEVKERLLQVLNLKESERFVFE